MIKLASLQELISFVEGNGKRIGQYYSFGYPRRLTAFIRIKPAKTKNLGRQWDLAIGGYKLVISRKGHLMPKDTLFVHFYGTDGKTVVSNWNEITSRNQLRELFELPDFEGKKQSTLIVRAYEGRKSKQNEIRGEAMISIPGLFGGMEFNPPKKSEIPPGKYDYYAEFFGQERTGSFTINPGQTYQLTILFDKKKFYPPAIRDETLPAVRGERGLVKKDDTFYPPARIMSEDRHEIHEPEEPYNNAAYVIVVIRNKTEVDAGAYIRRRGQEPIKEGGVVIRGLGRNRVVVVRAGEVERVEIPIDVPGDYDCHVEWGTNDVNPPRIDNIRITEKNIEEGTGPTIYFDLVQEYGSDVQEPNPIVCPNCGKCKLSYEGGSKNRQGDITYYFWCKEEGKMIRLSENEYNIHKDRDIRRKDYRGRMEGRIKNLIATKYGGKHPLKMDPKMRRRYERDANKIKNELARDYDFDKKDLELVKKGQDKRKNVISQQFPMKYKPLRKIESHGFNFMKIFPLFALTALGFIISVMLNNMYFMLGFLSWGMYYVFPSPSDYKTPISAKKFVPFRELFLNFGQNLLTNRGNGWALIRSIFKIAAITCFALGFKESTFPFANVALIVVAFIGYFSLKLQWNNQAEYIESVLRFGLLGVFLIPWIFFSIFESALLGLIAIAFFAIPPKPANVDKYESEEIRGMWELIDKFLFAGIMLFVLIASGAVGGVFGWSAIVPVSGWELTGTLASVFLYFWLVSAFAGFFSPAQTRPATGFIMLGAAVILFALGPGTQEVGGALLGPMWPTFYVGFEQTMQPLNVMFAQLGSTIGTGLYMITNPVGYAQGMLNGSYVQDPTTGLTGAFGVEMEGITSTPIYIEQPFYATVKIKNKGAFDAENVCVDLSTNIRYKNKYLQDTAFETPGLGDNYIDPTMLGILTTRQCVEGGDLTKLDSRQFFFESTGITCNLVNRAELIEKFIPLNATLEYDYKIHSNFEMEFMSREEWDRRVGEGSLVTFAKKAAKLSNSPALLNIDTLEQPIREGTRYHLQFALLPAQSQKNAKIKNAVIELRVPDAMGNPTSCSTTPENGLSGTHIPNENTNLYRWNNLPESHLVFCMFDPINNVNTTQTFLITANASYTFMTSQIQSTKLEFGGVICEPEYPEVEVDFDKIPVPKPADAIKEYDGIVRQASADFGVDANLIRAVINRESNWNPNAVSGAGANGLMQIIDGTAGDINQNKPYLQGFCDSVTIENIFDPEDNVRAGTCYLKFLLERYKDTSDPTRLALAAYNWGYGRVDDRISTYGDSWDDIKTHSVPTETQQYVPIIMHYYDFYKGEFPS